MEIAGREQFKKSLNQSSRQLSIEFFKAAGIIYLIILHQVVWLFIQGDTGNLIFKESYSFIDSFGYHSGLHVLGFQFPLLAGTSFLFYLKQKSPHWRNILFRWWTYRKKRPEKGCSC